MTIIENFEKYCQSEVIPALKEDAEEGWWEGITGSSFKTERGEDYYTIYTDYSLANLFVIRLSLWGVLEDDKRFLINCKATVVCKQVGDDYIAVFIEGCRKLLSKWGFGVSSQGSSLCAWASLDEDDGEYNVEDVNTPYELYSFFIDIIVEMMSQIGKSL